MDDTNSKNPSGHEPKPSAGRKATGASGISRRQFCAAGVASAIMVGLGALGDTALADDGVVYLRPPGYESERDLLSRCDRCQRCVQACPYHLIQPRPLSADFPTVGTPELDFKEGFCDFCMKCTDACPTGALRAGTASYRDIGVAKVINNVCIAWDWGGCTVCADACPVEGAIVLDDRGRPHVREDLCNGCGRCERECPASSLRAYDRSTVDGGIYVVNRASLAAATPGAITSDQLTEGMHRAASADARKEAGRE